MTAAGSKLAGFAVVLAVLFGAGLLAGGLIDPAPPKVAKAPHEQDAIGAAEAKSTDADAYAHGAAGEAAHGGEADDAGDTHGATDTDVRGLAVADNGLRLVVDGTNFARGTTRELRFHIVDTDGETVREFDVEHTKRMHLIVVRRDLTGFQHLHPRDDGNGKWSTPLTLASAGAYRMFADFSRGDEPTTLAADITVDGRFEKRPLPAPAAHASTATGFDVEVVARDRQLEFQISRDGKRADVEPYLGANGHLVALREGDLAFLHVHPSGGTTFATTFPTPGNYRLFLQFKVDGRVHTAAFTREVA